MTARQTRRRMSWRRFGINASSACTRKRRPVARAIGPHHGARRVHYVPGLGRLLSSVKSRNQVAFLDANPEFGMAYMSGFCVDDDRNFDYPIANTSRSSTRMITTFHQKSGPRSPS